ncbi:MAG: hypothetical protein H6834_18180 [Planctomycetes bacterium]|nr:hypothetical protein [Planctomycetota bacterium]MCB9891516.1 hypothetical protein [Planctomycetota bacterium]
MIRTTLIRTVLALSISCVSIAGDFVGLHGNGALYSIDTGTGSATSLGNLTYAPRRGFSVMDRGPQGRLLAIAPELITGYTVYEIDEATRTANMLFRVNSPMSGPVGVAVSPSGGTLWVMGFRSQFLSMEFEEVDLTTGVHTTRGLLGGNLRGLAFDGSGELFTYRYGAIAPDLIRVDRTNAANSTVVGRMTGVDASMGLDLASKRTSATVGVYSLAAESIFSVATATGSATQFGRPLVGALGIVTIAEGACANVVEYGAGCAGRGGFTPTLSVGGCPGPGAQLSIGIASGPGGSTAAVVLGVGALQVPLGGGCDALVNPLGVNITLVLDGTGPGEGSYVLPILLPSSLPQGSFTLQAACVDPAAAIGFTVTNGVQVAFP